MRYIAVIFLIVILSVFSEKKGFTQEKTSITKVVIDAGHGGKDPGTIGKKAQEKNIALQIALKLSEDIRNQCKGVTVILTRTTDEFIELHERAEIANRCKADLFISIHCNSNPKHTFHGAETYVMGLHRTEANLDVAKKENAAILMEPNYSSLYNGFDPNSDESYITFTLFQNAYLDQSTRFASFVQDEMKDRVGMDDRGVRQAGFLVLYKTTMPSVLVETGFLSNPEEEKFLMTEKGQQYIASAICRAFCKFKAKQEGSGKELASLNNKRSNPSSIDKPIISIKKDTSPGKEKSREITVTKDTIKAAEISVQTTEPKEISKSKQNDKGYLAIRDTSKVKQDIRVVPKNKSTIASERKTSYAHQPKEPVNNKPVSKVQPSLSNIDVSKKDLPTKPLRYDKVLKEIIVFRVQIATSPKDISIHSSKFAGLPEIWMYQHQGLFKYTAGKASSPEALSGLVKRVKNKGFTDAFIVAFNDKERITIAEAKKLISESQK
jgi:N-acetylmuramoyl-L-alanine amidase